MHITTTITEHPFWKSYALLVARVLMGGVFLWAAYTKFADLGATAGYIASAGIPFGLAFAWIAAFFEAALGLAIITGVFFREASILLGAYVLFLTFAFHGPSSWASNAYEFGLFVNHFTMIAGLLFMTAHGPGDTWTLKMSGEEIRRLIPHRA